MIPHFRSNYQKSFPKQIFSSATHGSSIYNLIRESEKFKLVPQILVFLVENIDMTQPSELKHTNSNAFQKKNLFDVSIDIGMDNPLRKMKSSSNISLQSKILDESHEQIQSRHSSIYNSKINMSHHRHSSILNSKMNRNVSLVQTADKEPIKTDNLFFAQESFQKISLASEIEIPNNSKNPKLHVFGIFVNQHFQFLSSRQDNCFGDDSSFFFYLNQNKIQTFSPNLKKRKFLHVNSQNIFLGKII